MIWRLRYVMAASFQLRPFGWPWKAIIGHWPVFWDWSETWHEKRLSMITTPDEAAWEDLSNA